MIEIIGGLWTAGETKTFVINGEYLEILEAQYPCDVMLMDKSGAQLSIMRSSEASFFSRPKEGFQTVQIASAQAQAIRVFIGSGDAGTRRISSTVSVIDGSRARADAGVAFATYLGATAVAGQFSVAQLWNPAGSGKRVVVNQVAAAVSVTQGVKLYPNNVALGADFSASNISNKKMGSPIGAAQARYGSVVSPLTSFGLLQNMQGSVTANTVWRPTEALLIPPGFGLVMYGDSLNTGVAANFEWFEEAI